MKYIASIYGNEKSEKFGEKYPLWEDTLLREEED